MIDSPVTKQTKEKHNKSIYIFDIVPFSPFSIIEIFYLDAYWIQIWFKNFAETLNEKKKIENISFTSLHLFKYLRKLKRQNLTW